MYIQKGNLKCKCGVLPISLKKGKTFFLFFFLMNFICFPVPSIKGKLKCSEVTTLQALRICTPSDFKTFSAGSIMSS